MRTVFAAVLIAAALAAGCSNSDQTPAAPTAPTNVAGTWAGNVTVADASTRMAWTLSQTGAAVTGPVTLALSNGIVLLNGFLTGTISGTTLTYTISVGPGGIPLQPSCAGQISGTMAVNLGAVSTMTGSPTVTSSTCTAPFPGGTITLTKQGS